MWESFKEVWPRAFLVTTFWLVMIGLFFGIRMVLKDEKKRRSDKKKNRQKIKRK